jgi:hypothetical protein
MRISLLADGPFNAGRKLVLVQDIRKEISLHWYG